MVGTAVPDERRKPALLPLVVVAMASGMLAAGAWQIPAGASLGLAIGFLLTMFVLHRQTESVWRIALALSCVCCGMAWYSVRIHWIQQAHIATYATAEPKLVTIRGKVVDVAEPMERRGDLASFSVFPPQTRLTIRAASFVNDDDQITPTSGLVYVHVATSSLVAWPGDDIECTGFLRAIGAPLNPGQRDARPAARARGVGGGLHVPHDGLVRINTTYPEMTIFERFARWRSQWNHAARTQLSRAWNLHDDNDEHARAVVGALLLGDRRSAAYAEAQRPFQRTGLAHMLAISGMHLGLLAAVLRSVLRCIFAYRRVQWFVMLVAIGFYICLIDARMPALRAAMMIAIWCVASFFQRDIKATGGLALAAAILLIWRPDQIHDPGFQLSFGVVLAIITCSMPLRRRWFGPPDLEAPTFRAMLFEKGKTAWVVTIVAWIAATPIIMLHFGMISPLAAPLTLLMVPLVTLLLIAGLICLAASALVPDIMEVMVTPAQWLLSCVDLADGLGWSHVVIAPPTGLWSLVVFVAALLWMRRATVDLRVTGVIVLSLLAWHIGPRLPWSMNDALRIDMLAVGDGSCYLIRAGDETLLFDGGSRTDANVGERIIVPALRALGVRHLDTIVISHADFDHFAGIPAIIQHVDVGRVIVTPQFLRSASANPDSAPAALWARVQEQDIPIETYHAGDIDNIAHWRMRWLHPPPDETYKRRNDSSMVICIDDPSRPNMPATLLTGDIQPTGIAQVWDDIASLDIAILELPHHGSHRTEAESFVRHIDAPFILQSTGPSRLTDRRWDDALASSSRFITARDGAVTLRITPDGRVFVDSFLNLPEQVIKEEVEANFAIE